MIRLFLLAVAAVAIVAVGYVVLPRNIVRPNAHLSTPPVTAAADAGTFVVHDAAPATAPIPPVPNPIALQASRPAVPASQTSSATPAAPSTPDLDSLMQRLRAASADPANTTTPAPTPPPAVPAQPAPQPTPAVITPTTAPPASFPPASRWTNITGQGARWRMTQTGSGYTIAIDLGAGRVAEIHVAPAFASLDSAGVNQRVDYLKQTILQNFPPESASYTFARDGSVSLDH